jgi:hypothetical protein
MSADGFEPDCGQQCGDHAHMLAIDLPPVLRKVRPRHEVWMSAYRIVTRLTERPPLRPPRPTPPLVLELGEPFDLVRGEVERQCILEGRDDPCTDSLQLYRDVIRARAAEFAILLVELFPRPQRS